MDQSIIYFVQDFAELLYERAKEVQENCKNLEHNADNADIVKFERGRALAYYEVVSLFVSQAKTFDVLNIISSLKEIEPDQLLG